MKRLSKMTAGMAGLLVALACTVSSAGDPYGHFDEIAKDIERQAGLFLKETRHYRHTPQYRHLVSDAVALARTARHAHVTAHVGCSLTHLEEDVRQLDRTLHHVADLLHDIEYGAGHVHGDTRHVHRLLHVMTSDVHHLLSDLREMRAAVHNPHVPRRPVVVSRRVPVGWGNNSVYDSLYGRQDGHRTGSPHSHRSGRSRDVPPGWGNSSLHRWGW